MEHVPRLQTGNDVPGPRKHFRPQRASMTVRSWRPGASFFQPLDGDGIFNIQDRDDNGDCWLDWNDAFDADGDGTPDYADLDPGGDGVITPNFQPGSPGDPFDLDGDGVPNVADWDKDGDGIAD